MLYRLSQLILRNFKVKNLSVCEYMECFQFIWVLKICYAFDSHKIKSHMLIRASGEELKHLPRKTKVNGFNLARTCFF